MIAFRPSNFRLVVPFIGFGLLAACAGNDLADPPVPLGDFRLGLNIAVADNAEKVPISRTATEEEWETAVKKAVDDRFGRYQGTKLYNIGISVDGYALAPPGIPVIAAPKSVLVVTANIWDDAARKKLNTEGEQFTIFEGLSGETVIGTGLTRTREQQIEALSFNAVKRIEEWLVENGAWFGQAPPPKATPASEPRVVSRTAEPAVVAVPVVVRPQSAVVTTAPITATPVAATPSAPTSTAPRVIGAQ